MNKVILMGRLVREPDVRTANNNMTVARYTLAVERKFKKDGEASADFINCITFGKNAEFVEKYLKKGVKIAVTGRIQTGSYTNKDGNKVYTTDIVVEEHEFAESRKSQQDNQPQNQQGNASEIGTAGSDGFMNIPDGIDAELPFN